MARDTGLNAQYLAYKRRPLADRRAEYRGISRKHPGRLAVLLRFGLDRSHFVPIESSAPVKFKYLVPHDVTLGAFLQTIRTRLPGLRPDATLFLLLQDAMPVMTQTLGAAARDAPRDDDGFLTMHVLSENAFGAS